MFDLAQFARESYMNAIDHGFHDKKRTHAEGLNLIFAEWAEALESLRKDEAPVFFVDDKDGNKKPEGWAVELIDGVIRIFDYTHEHGKEYSNWDVDDAIKQVQEKYEMNDTRPFETLMVTLLNLNIRTARAAEDVRRNNAPFFWLMECVGHVLECIRQNGMNPYDILTEKQEYNKKRPYKHGKKF